MRQLYAAVFAVGRYIVPAGIGPVGVLEALVAAKLVRSLRNGLTVEVAWTRDKGMATAGDRARGKVRIVERSDSDGEVEAFLNKIDLAVREV